MIKGVIVGVAIIFIMPFIPIVHFVGVPFGPFIAGYIGISSASSYPGSAGRKALVFGTIFGVVMGFIFVVAAAIVELALGEKLTEASAPFRVLLWAGVVVFTFYYSSMSALGAWYAGLKAGG